MESDGRVAQSRGAQSMGASKQNKNNNNSKQKQKQNAYGKALASVCAVTRREPGPPAGAASFRDWLGH